MTGHDSYDDNRACDSVEVENLLVSAQTVKKGGRHSFQSFLEVIQYMFSFNFLTLNKG